MISLGSTGGERVIPVNQAQSLLFSKGPLSWKKGFAGAQYWDLVLVREGQGEGRNFPSTFLTHLMEKKATKSTGGRAEGNRFPLLH